MTTLQAFQSEIDQIHAKEVNRQRAQAATDKEKEANTNAKKGKADAKAAVILQDAKVGVQKATAVKADAKNGKANPPTRPGLDTKTVPTATKQDAETSPTIEKIAEADDDRVATAEEEAAEIITLLLRRTPADSERAKDLVSGLLTRNRGEFIFRLGQRPPNAVLFNPQSKEQPAKTDEWLGAARSPEEIDTLRKELTAVVEEVGGKASILFEQKEPDPRLAILLRLPPPNISLTPEVRVAVVGNVDAGKSSFLGVLTRGTLDDGRGKARVGLFRHKHEIETGRTSSVGMEILGFAPSGEPILPHSTTTADTDVARRDKLGWDVISTHAAKIVSFIDLAGHERYLKTTLYGLTSGAPSCVFLIVGANAGLIGMSKEHLAIALALNVPVVVCITKIDMTPPNVQAETVKQVVKILRSPGCRKTPVFVRSKEVAVEISQAYAKDRICPIFLISNVTGEGLDYVRTFLNLLPSSEGDTDKYMPDQPFEYSVTEVWSVPYAGTVVSGILNSGSVKVGDQVLLGPDGNGQYLPTVIKTMQRKRANVTSAEAGQSVTFALKRVRKQAVRKGMIIVHKTETPPKVTKTFEGQVLILYHNTTLQKGYQAMLHCGAIRQTVRIVGIDHDQGVLRTGDRATVQFEFISNPEFIRPGWKLLFREGKTKGLGVVTKLL